MRQREGLADPGQLFSKVEEFSLSQVVEPVECLIGGFPCQARSCNMPLTVKSLSSFKRRSLHRRRSCAGCLEGWTQAGDVRPENRTLHPFLG